MVVTAPGQRHGIRSRNALKPWIPEWISVAIHFKALVDYAFDCDMA